MGFLQKALQWLSGREKESEEEDREARRHLLRAMARAVAMAVMADGQKGSQEMLTARLERAKIPVLSQLKDSAFEALAVEAFAKLNTEGEETSLRFIAESITDPVKRAGTFSLSAAIILADHEITESEEEFLKKLQRALAISEEDATEMIEALRKERGDRRVIEDLD